MERRASRDEYSGCGRRPKHAPAEELKDLSTDELEEELTVAAYAPGRVRFSYFEQLLAERRRRLIAA
jgi:hypothetical protein